MKMQIEVYNVYFFVENKEKSMVSDLFGEGLKNGVEIRKFNRNTKYWPRPFETHRWYTANTVH